MLSGHLSVRSHLEDLAKRHPDLAGHLRCPPWGGETSSKGWSRKRTVSGEDNTSEEPSDLNHSSTERTESSPDKKRFEENMDKQQPNFVNNSRSQENDKPQRFVSKLEFTPVNPNNQSENVQQPQQFQQQKEPQNDTPSHGNQKQSNVRHIPIYVEGRTEPVYPKNIDKSSESNSSTFPKRTPGKQIPFAQHHSFHDQNNAQRRQTPSSQQQQNQQTPPQDARSTPPPPPRQQVKPVDALEKVQTVQTEVEELAIAVSQFSGSSRTDKQYIYLDEMLTRNLIKLDIIETEGRDDVRVARKKAIKTIQDTISILENKVPQPQEEAMAVEELTENSTEAVPVENETSEIEKVECNN